MKVKLLFIILAFLLFGTAFGADTEPLRSFGDGEKLTYTVSYRAALVPNSEVAQVVFSVKKGVVDGIPTYNIHANGKVFPFYRWFFDLNDTYQTWLNASTLRPIKFTSDIREGKYRFSSTFAYDWNNMVVNTTYRNLKHANNKHRTMSLSPMSFDALSLLYNLRESDPTHFTAGQSRMLKLVIEDTIRHVGYKYLGRETTNIRGVGKFKTLKFTCQLVTSSGESFEDGTEFILWISDDKNKLPLLIESPIRVGSIRAKLTEYKNLSYPLDSKLK